jgi:hypothetical protein
VAELEVRSLVRESICKGLGHGAGDVAGLYELRDVAQYLADDARMLREFISIADVLPYLKLESGA